jgi:hypothetical protein
MQKTEHELELKRPNYGQTSDRKNECQFHNREASGGAAHAGQEEQPWILTIKGSK